MSNRIKVLFEMYSADLVAQRGEQYREKYLCPQCLRRFSWNDFLSGTLTREHVPPQAVGSKFVTFTCRDCNNRSGSKLDAELVTHIKIRDCMEGDISLLPLAKLKVGKGEIAMHTNSYGSTIEIHTNRGRSNPVLAAKVDDFFEANVGATNWQFSVKGRFNYSHKGFLAGALRLGYLVMYHHFGYSYVLEANLDPIRRQIQNPDPVDISARAVVDLTNTPLPDPAKKFGLHMVIEPAELRSFFITIPLKGRNSASYLGVFMPGPGAPAGNLYSARSAPDSLPRNLIWINFREGTTFRQRWESMRSVWRSFA